jgi:hypothetical protein
VIGLTPATFYPGFAPVVEYNVFKKQRWIDKFKSKYMYFWLEWVQPTWNLADLLVIQKRPGPTQICFLFFGKRQQYIFLKFLVNLKLIFRRVYAPCPLSRPLLTQDITRVNVHCSHTCSCTWRMGREQYQNDFALYPWTVFFLKAWWK